ncbi:glycosyltransferase [Rhodococcus pyridinivorans]
MRISVIIPTYNAAHLIGQQIDALEHQSYPGDFEIVVADNGSTDSTREYIEMRASDIRHTLRWVDASRRRGAAHARNVGANDATGEFLAFCDADDVVYPGWLETLVTHRHDADIIATAAEALPSDSEAGRRPLPAPENQGRHPFRPFISGGTFACLRSTYLDLGGMDERYLSNEDVAFSWRAQSAGLTVHTIPDVLLGVRRRNTIRACWKQGRSRAVGLAHVAAEFAADGHPAPRLSHLVLGAVGVVIANPLTSRDPRVRSPLDWAYLAGVRMGELEGAIASGFFALR